MSNLDEIKARRRKELLATLESRKESLRQHLQETTHNSVDLGKGLLIIGAGVLLLYTIVDRYLESKFKPQKTESASKTTKSSVNKLLYPIFTMLLQQGSGTLYELGQKKLIDYLKSKKTNK